MSELMRALQAWSGQFEGENRARSIEMMGAMATLIERAVRERHFGPIDSHGVTFAVHEGQIQRFQTRCNELN